KVMMRHILKFTTIVCGALFLHSCSDPYADSIELERFMYLSLSGSADGSIEQTVKLDEAFTYPLSVSYAGTTNYNQGEITANLAVDNALVERYNEENGTRYLPLPNEAWALDKTAITIPDGNRMSDVATLTVEPSSVDFAHEYLLPVVIQSASGDKIPVSDEFKTVYLILKGDLDPLPNENQWAVHDASSVWKPDFDVAKVFDGNRNSYW